MNPNAIINMFMQNNPQIQNNPMIKNAMQMAQQGDAKGIEQMARNIAKEKGVDINVLINQLKSNMRN